MEAEVAAQRQSAALAVAESERLRRETQEQLKLKTLEADSAQKSLRQLMEAEEREQKGIERLRQQCESYANQMQVATQGLAELLERQKVLANELHVFSQDIKAKEATTQQREKQQQQQQQQQQDEGFVIAAVCLLLAGYSSSMSQGPAATSGPAQSAFASPPENCQMQWSAQPAAAAAATHSTAATYPAAFAAAAFAAAAFAAAAAAIATPSVLV
ncbi:hypothetical protein ACSSS7_005197 [Eimeria intestinalis]